MIDKRTREVCKKNKLPPPPMSMSEHVEFMNACNRSLWKQFIKEIMPS